MKTKIYMMMAMLAVSMTSKAQSYEGSGGMYNTSFSEIQNMTAIYVQYQPSSFVPKDGKSTSFTAWSIGVQSYTPLSKTTPIYGDIGLKFQYSSKSENGADFTMFSIKVPFNVGYLYTLPNSSFSIYPKLGFSVGYHLSAKMKTGSTTINMFDSDDMGGDDYKWENIPIEWQVGIDFVINKKITFGVSYGTDITETAKNMRIHTTSITAGILF